MKSKFPFLFSLAVGIFLILHAAVNLSHYPDWDELDTSARLAHPESYVENAKDPYGNTDVTSPYKNTRNHALAAVGTRLSYALFGVSPESARLPSLFFAVLFAAGLVVFSRHSGMGFWYAGLGLYVLSNATLNWFFHSSRGYASMAVMALWMLGLCATTRRNAIAFGVFGLALVFTHAFGIFYFLIFGGCLVLVAPRSRFVRAWLAGVPVALSILGALYFFLNRSGLLQTKKPQPFSEALLYAFGLAPEPLNLAIGVTLATLVAIALVSYCRRADKFLPLFSLASLLFLAVLFYGLKPDYFDGRFLLAFTLPWVWTTLWTAARARRPMKLAIGTLALLFFVALPLKDSAFVWEKQTSHLKDFNDFMRRARRMAPLQTACVTTSGELDQARFAKDVFFSEASRRNDCDHVYRLHFGRNWAGSIPMETPKGSLVTPIYQDGKGRVLVRLSVPTDPTRISLAPK